MPLPGISGMDPPFGDAFQSYTFADQALTSTDLLANTSDPDFMYEQDTEMSCRQSPIFCLGDCKEIESMEQLSGVLEEPTCNSTFEQWDTYWEDLTKYTKLTSCDIWGTKEVDFLGLDDFSSPYQDEEVIGRTPTLAQLNSEDSQPVCDTLYHPDLLLAHNPSHPQNLPSALGRKPGVRLAPPTPPPSSAVKNPQPDFAEASCKPTWPVASTTETMSKAQTPVQKVQTLMSTTVMAKDYMGRTKVHLGTKRRVSGDVVRPLPEYPMPASSSMAAPLKVSTDSTDVATPSTCSPDRKLEKPRQEVAPAPEGSSQMHGSTQGSNGGDNTRDKEEEHNYSLFVAQAMLVSMVELEDKVEEDEEEEEEEEELEEAGLDDEDHDEGFGSEHELSENEEEEEDEEEYYEDDKDDDMSDSFSEPGCDNDAVEDIKGLTAGFSRKRGKRRYFWEYSEQLTPSKQERMLKPCEWDRNTLPSNMYQKNGLHHGKHAVKKSRRTDVEDLTPNPRKLLQIGNELHKLNKVISDLTPVSELPLNARPRSRKEKNKLASRACRLKKKAQYEANKVKLWGLNTEYDRLLFVINAIKEDIVNRVQSLTEDKAASMMEKLNRLIEETLVKSPVAGQTSQFVNQILENTAGGNPTGGLVGLRVPTSKM